MNKKGQAAMEFLMTYGWALLIVLIAIAALAFFGILNPSNFLPEKCDLGPGLEISAVSAGSDGISMLVTNGIGQQMYDVNWTIQECTGSTGHNTTIGDIGQGSTQRWSVQCTGMVNESKFTSEINISYGSRVSGNALEHTREGTCTVRIPATAGYGY